MNNKYKESLDYLFSIPMFQQIGDVALNLSLDNINILMETLGNPHKNFRSIHVAGTNGKGSVCHTLSSIFTEAGYKTGLFTSPHLFDFRERVRVNGDMIPQKDVVEFTDLTRDIIEKIKPSFFEVTTAMSFYYFAKQKVDIAIIEVGMGGRYDATNIITPILSVITNISLDHTAILGNTLNAIASEKAGIIKNGIPVVIGESNPQTLPVFVMKARECQAPIVFADKCFKCDDSFVADNMQIFRIKSLLDDYHFSLESDLCGIYQRKNLCTVLCALETLASEVHLAIPFETAKRGIANAKKNSTLIGRWHIFSESPLMVCDTAHNEDGIINVTQQISQCKYNRLFMILGFVADKDLSAILPLLPKNAYYFFTKPSTQRALSENELKKQAAEYMLNGECCTDVDMAINKALSISNSDDMIYIGGSTYVVAEITILKNKQQ